MSPDGAALVGRPVPHEGWAVHYDEVMHRTFGTAYEAFTRATLAEVGRLAAPPARIVDFGAGTGRVTLPLAAAGYTVTAVDRSPAMLAVLAARVSAEHGERVRCEASAVEQFRGDGAHDVALCVFTVLGYLLDEDALARAAAAMAGALRPGGRLLLDVPRREVFEGFEVADDRIIRWVEIVPAGATGDALFRYRERTVLRTAVGERRFEDEFRIRWWERSTVLSTFAAAGLELEEDRSHRFEAWGADYLVLRRTG